MWRLLVLLMFPACAAEPPLGLGAMPEPETNPSTPAKVELGRTLFFDKALSRDGTVSCATCHEPEQAFAQPGVAVSQGVGGRRGTRNAPTLLNIGYAKHLFHDGRASSLEDQAWKPILDPNEMGNKNEATVLERLARSPRYPALFRAAFERAPDRDGVAQALAAFQRTLLAANSRFDRWTWGEDSLTELEERGEALFSGRAQCWNCHLLRGETLLYSDQLFHNTGVSPGKDPGRFVVTGKEEHRGAFKTPTLRDVSKTAPYMHDGSLKTLKEVLSFYNKGEGPDLQPLGLSEAEVDALVAFLRAFDSQPPKVR